MTGRARAVVATAVLAAMSTAVSAPAGAQESLLPSTGWGTGFSLTAWHFQTALPQTAGGLADVAEAVVPFRVRSVFGRFSVDVSAAGVYGAAHFTQNGSTSPSGQGNSGGSGGSERVITLAGATDVKLRFNGPLFGDALQFTAGLNLPTGKVGLNADETSTLQVLGAPALRMPIAALGTGTGYTLGILHAFEGDDWAIAIGASVEQRSEYSPIALALAGGSAETRITPGTAAHVTLGIDRVLGDGRFSALLVGDLFSTDKVRQTVIGSPDQTADYKLGPQLTAFTKLDFGAAGWRESSLSLAVRRRSPFTDASGAGVAGSAATYVEGALGGVLGGTSGAGLIIAADARWQSGMKFTDAMVGAAATAVGVTLGVERAGSSTLTRFYVHGQYGAFDTGTTHSTGIGATLGVSVSALREAK